MVECVKAKYSMVVVNTQEGCQGPAGCSRNNCTRTKGEWDVEKTKQGAEPWRSLADHTGMGDFCWQL